MTDEQEGGKAALNHPKARAQNERVDEARQRAEAAARSGVGKLWSGLYPLKRPTFELNLMGLPRLVLGFHRGLLIMGRSMEVGSSRATENKRIRQEALREYIQERGSVQYLFDLIEKAEELDPTDPDFDKKLAKMKLVFDQRQKMLDKYMPALKASEISLEANLKATQVDMMGVDTDDIEARHD